MYSGGLANTGALLGGPLTALFIGLGVIAILGGVAALWRARPNRHK